MGWTFCHERHRLPAKEFKNLFLYHYSNYLIFNNCKLLLQTVFIKKKLNIYIYVYVCILKYLII